MPRKGLEVSVRQHPLHLAIIELHGEINDAGEEKLATAYSEARSGDITAILLDFSDVEYINSTGIALIVQLLSQARLANLTLIACGLNAHYIEIFRITRLVDFMQVFPDEDSAIQSYHAGS
jgi:anti-sigma B factor antagonist